VIVSSWLSNRTALPPARLAARIDEALGGATDSPLAEMPERCVEAAERMLNDLVARPSSGRESALDLLTVDALVTYAFEAASESPDTLAVRAEDAMRRLAAIARA
jgi:hypothetical protein